MFSFPNIKQPICSHKGDHLNPTAIDLFGKLGSDQQLEHRLRIASVLVAVAACLKNDGATIQLLFDNDEAFENEKAFPAKAIGPEIADALSERPMQRFLATMCIPVNGNHRIFALTRPADVPQDRAEFIAARDILAIPDTAAGGFLARDRCVEGNDPNLSGTKSRMFWNWLLERDHALKRVLGDMHESDGRIMIGLREAKP